MNSEKLSTVEWIIFKLQTLRSAEDEVKKQVSQIIRYTPLRFSILFVIGRLLLPVSLFFIWILLWINYECQNESKPSKLLIQSNNLFCPISEHSLKSPSIIIPAAWAASIHGIITTSH